MSGYVRFDGMTWPCQPSDELIWRVRNGDNWQADRFLLASIVDAYHELIRCPRTKREAVIRRLREKKP